MARPLDIYPPSMRRNSLRLFGTLLLLVTRLALPAAAQQPPPTGSGEYVGFDRNLYPGDAALPALHRQFSFLGYWLNNPPGAASNSWIGKRDRLRRAGFGFLLLWNGRLDRDILAASRHQTAPDRLGTNDAEAAIAAARREHFPPGAILFLDQEEGGRLLPEQAAYLLAWSETIAHSGFLPGVYASGQPVADGPGHTITTAEDIRLRVAAQHLHPIALWVAQDACPPSNGCSLTPPPLTVSGTPGALVWQYAQSPRRPAGTEACRQTYASDGNCYSPALQGLFLDLDAASSPDPSHGR